MADDDDDDEERRERGPRTKFENNEEHYKYEYRDHRCKYKYEYKYRTGKTKVEQKGDCRGIVMARPVAHGESLPRAIPPGPQARKVTCNREVLGAIIGGAIGAGVGSRVDKGGECRRYLLQTMASGQLQKHTGTACRQDNGSWALVD